jgi:hypothetical protein
VTDRKRQDPDQVRKERIADIARQLMDAFNHARNDPSLMAVNGHDTHAGYEFFIERSGEVFVVEIRKDME